MDRKLKHYLIAIAFGVVLFVGLTHLDVVIAAIGTVLKLLLPVLIGLVVAFVLNVPVSGFEKLFAKMFPKNKVHTGWRRPVGLVLTILCILVALAAFSVLVVPELISAVETIIAKINANWPQWMEFLTKTFGADSVLMQWLGTVDLQKMLEGVLSGATSVIGSVASVAVTAVSGISTAIFGLIVAIYVVLGKHTLGRHTKKLLQAYTSQQATDKICHVAKLCSDTYSRFLSGQCLEALILGVLVYLVFTIFRLPAAAVVAVVAVFCAFVPYVGAFITGVFAGILALLVSPEMALWSIIAYIVTQFVENQFIYPHVVGSSVGLSALWTLMAVLVGGSMFGLLGIIFFIPLVAVIYELVSENVQERLAKKNAVGTRRREAVEKLKNAANDETE